MNKKDNCLVAEKQLSDYCQNRHFPFQENVYNEYWWIIVLDNLLHYLQPSMTNSLLPEDRNTLSDPWNIYCSFWDTVLSKNRNLQPNESSHQNKHFQSNLLKASYPNNIHKSPSFFENQQNQGAAWTYHEVQ